MIYIKYKIWKHLLSKNYSSFRTINPIINKSIKKSLSKTRAKYTSKTNPQFALQLTKLLLTKLLSPNLPQALKTFNTNPKSFTTTPKSQRIPPRQKNQTLCNKTPIHSEIILLYPNRKISKLLKQPSKTLK